MKHGIQQLFEMVKLGEVHYFMGIQVWKLKNGIFFSQNKYAYDRIRRFHMENMNNTPPFV